jgi:flagellar basal body rod protein FlgC
MDPISTARYGMMAATRQLDAAASNIAGGDADYAGAAVDMIEAKHAFQANVGVIKVADEMWQSLLDLQTD